MGDRYPLNKLLAVVGVGVLLGGIGGCGRGVEKTPPGLKPINILLISIDSLRADHVGVYGYNRPTTPEIDRLAGEGSIFLNNLSTTSWTLPAHISIFTGEDISTHGVATDGFSLHSAIPTLPEILQKAGWRTAAFCTSPYMNPAFGFARGFDLYHNTDSERADYVDTIIPQPSARDLVHRDITSPRITELAVDWLETNADQPFFLFLHFWDVHYDYNPPPPYDRIFNPGYTGEINGRDYMNNTRINSEMDPRDLEQIIALYDGEIAYTDQHLGMVFRKLQELGVDDRTLIIVTADHGDEFFEHGEKGHRLTLYEEVIRTPLIIRLPGGERGAESIASPVGIIDIAPTILDFLGLERPESFQGRSLLPLLAGETPKEDRYILVELPPILYVLRGPRYKLLYNSLAEQSVLLDLAADPAETHSPEIVSGPIFERLNRELQSRLRHNRELADKLRGNAPGEEIRLQKRELDRLRTLGYL